MRLAGRDRRGRGRRGRHAGPFSRPWEEPERVPYPADPDEPPPPPVLSPALVAWDAAADAWTQTVRTATDPVRNVTERTIARLVRQVPPGPMLDAGCGEGWLARELAGQGVSVMAIDGAPRMVELAQQACGAAEYRRVSFEEAGEEPRRLGGAYGTVVFNFSLLDERITPILDAVGSALFPYGRILIQAAHPSHALHGGGEGYRDGWRMPDPTSPGVPLTPAIPWYFRTFSTWVLELRRAGLLLVETYEPVDPDTARPVSLILHATVPERRH